MDCVENSSKMVKCTLVNTKMDLEMDKVNTIFPKKSGIRVNGWRVNLKELEDINGRMGLNIMGISNKVCDGEKVN